MKVISDETESYIVARIKVQLKYSTFHSTFNSLFTVKTNQYGEREWPAKVEIKGKVKFEKRFSNC